MRTMLILCLLAAPTITLAQQHSHLAHVDKIRDGNTMFVSDSSGSNIPVRVLGIACQSKKVDKVKHKEEWVACIKKNKHRNACVDKIAVTAKRARVVATKSLLRKDVILLCAEAACAKDSAGYRLQYVQLPNSVDYGLMVVQEGICDIATDQDHPRKDSYLQAQEKAKKNKVGIWK